MNLIEIRETENGKAVSARELHKALDLSERFSKFMERNLEYGFSEGIDYTPYQMVHPQNKQEITDYVLTLDCAKHISMVQRSEKGKKLRQYFIDFEKNTKSLLPNFNNPVEAARAWADEKEKTLLAESKVKELEPKAEFYDQVTESTDTVDMAIAAKVLNLGIGRNKLFEFLRYKKVLQTNNIPYQSKVDAGYFRVIESKYNDSYGSVRISFKTVVFQKGLDYITKLWNNRHK